MFRKQMLGYLLGGVALALSPVLVAPGHAAPPGGSSPGQAKKAESPPGNPNCAKDNGKASPSKANAQGNACGQKANPPYN